MADIHTILQAAESGDAGAARELAVLLYDELREFARRELAGERPQHTLQPTALVNEAYLRLVGGAAGSFATREAFFGAAAVAMRRVLIDHARARMRDKRGGGAAPISLEGLDVASTMEPSELFALDAALTRLATLDPQKSRIVELRFFAGLTEIEVGKAIGASESTVRREWRLARAWLRAELERHDGS